MRGGIWLSGQGQHPLLQSGRRGETCLQKPQTVHGGQESGRRFVRPFECLIDCWCFMPSIRHMYESFSCLQTTIMNKHLGSLMEGLSAKVFRTYNASFTLQQQLDELTKGIPTVYHLQYTQVAKKYVWNGFSIENHVMFSGFLIILWYAMIGSWKIHMCRADVSNRL